MLILEEPLLPFPASSDLRDIVAHTRGAEVALQSGFVLPPRLQEFPESWARFCGSYWAQDF